MKQAIVGGILKRMNGSEGFVISFKTAEEARKYKEAFVWYLENDKYKVTNKRGCHDAD